MLGFPNPVNEKAARVVAAGVALFVILALVTGWHWLLAVLAVGFWARVFTGPGLSPLGRLATDVVAPRLGPPRYVPGSPKRFAQTIGAVVTTTGTVLLLILGTGTATTVVLAIMLAFSLLESVAGICVGCIIFGWLMRLGVIPQKICEECADLSRRYA